MRYSTAVDSYKTKRLDDLVCPGTEATLQKGEVFQTTDTNLLMSIVISGYVKRYSIRNDGSLAVQSIYGPNYYFPLTLAHKLLLNQEVYSGPEVFHYEAMTETVLRSIDSETFREAVDKDPLLYKDLLYVSGRRTHSNIQRLENMNLSTSYKRVAHQLAYFAEMFGTKQKGARITIDVPLTHQDIADVISSTRETVSLALAELKREKIIRSGPGKHIIVLDYDRLNETAYA